MFSFSFIIILIACVGFPVCTALALFPTVETASIGTRLEGLNKAGQAKQNTGVALRDQDEMNKSIVSRLILPILDRLSKVMSGILPAQTMNELKIAIVQAGLTNSINPAQIMVASYLLMVGMPCFLLIFTGWPDGLLSEGSVILVLGALMGWKLPGMMIKGRATTRKHQIQKDLPFVLDLISISVEAGMALDGALAIVTEKTTGPLTDELNQSLREMRLGKGRNDALIDMGLRLGVDDLKSFITAVTYIAKLGGSLVDVIKIQAGAMRTKRRQRAEEKAMKTPVKIMIPLVLFIFPSMFIVILGPAALQMIEELVKVPGGG